MATARSRHRPERRCMACRQRGFKSDLLRLTAGEGGALYWDLSGQGQGRGGYLHPRRECLARFAGLKVEKFTSLRRSIDRAERSALVKMMLERLATSPQHA